MAAPNAVDVPTNGPRTGGLYALIRSKSSYRMYTVAPHNSFPHVMPAKMSSVHYGCEQDQSLGGPPHFCAFRKSGAFSVNEMSRGHAMTRNAIGGVANLPPFSALCVNLNARTCSLTGVTDSQSFSSGPHESVDFDCWLPDPVPCRRRCCLTRDIIR